jgi:hypothetical protein
MESKWITYQKDASQFFANLGLSTALEESVSGVRGKHKIDVLVTGKVHGLQIRWIVECKHWTSNVTKEKVLALLAIVQDIGADKGILLSEVGFQSGAIRVSKNTNLLLTSLADLREEIKDTFAETVIASLHWRITKVSDKLWALHRLEQDGFGSTPAFSERTKLAFLEMAFNDAMVGQYPTIYAIGPNDMRLAASNFDDLVREADKLITSAEAFANNYRGPGSSG